MKLVPSVTLPSFYLHKIFWSRHVRATRHKLHNSPLWDDWMPSQTETQTFWLKSFWTIICLFEQLMVITDLQCNQCSPKQAPPRDPLTTVNPLSHARLWAHSVSRLYVQTRTKLFVPAEKLSFKKCSNRLTQAEDQLPDPVGPREPRAFCLS